MPTSILNYFAYEHLPPKLQEVSKPIGDLAYQLDALLPAGPEKTTGLRKLLEVKDCFVRRALDKNVILPCAVTSETVNGDQLHQGSTGGLVITGERFITVKLPYGISANDIWRATIDESTGKQRNSLSIGAKKFKRRVFEIYAPIFKALKLKAISQQCEIRLLVQPPRKNRSYSASSYPRFDIDNYPKLLIDSLKGTELLFKDDNIFVKEKIEFAEPIENGCVWLSCVFINETNWLDKKVDFEWLAGRVA